MVQEHKHRQRHTQRVTEKDRVVDQHIDARIIGNGEGCYGDYNHTRKTTSGHEFALVPLFPVCLYMYTIMRQGQCLRQLQ